MPGHDHRFYLLKKADLAIPVGKGMLHYPLPQLHEAFLTNADTAFNSGGQIGIYRFASRKRSCHDCVSSSNVDSKAGMICCLALEDQVVRPSKINEDGSGYALFPYSLGDFPYSYGFWGKFVKNSGVICCFSLFWKHLTEINK